MKSKREETEKLKENSTGMERNRRAKRRKESNRVGEDRKKVKENSPKWGKNGKKEKQKIKEKETD